MSFLTAFLIAQNHALIYLVALPLPICLIKCVSFNSFKALSIVLWEMSGQIMTISDLDNGFNVFSKTFIILSADVKDFSPISLNLSSHSKYAL